MRTYDEMDASIARKKKVAVKITWILGLSTLAFIFFNTPGESTSRLAVSALFTLILCAFYYGFFYSLLISWGRGETEFLALKLEARQYYKQMAEERREYEETEKFDAWYTESRHFTK